MMMIVESEEVVKTFPVRASELEQIGEELGVKSGTAPGNL